jgi:CheY-like chemotaxis protein
VLILDDDRSNLEAVASVCTDYLNIPQQRVALLHVRAGTSLAHIKEQTEGLLKTAIASTGACFGSLITDYNLSPTMTSLEIWRAVEADLSEAPYNEPWARTARVLMTASTDEAPIIKAETDRIIDTHILKPFKISLLERALITSILARMG